MRGFVLKLVRELVAERPALSRNRHFDTFDDPAGRQALRVSRHLRSLERDILAHRGSARAVVHRESGETGVRIRLELGSLRARRVAYLSDEEYQLLLERPGVSEALGGE